jgi:DNA-binding NarL/FixJ family response regulator
LIEAALRTEGDLTALARNAAHLNLRCVNARARRRLPPGAPLTAAERGQTLWEILQEAIGRLRPADEMDPRITRAWRQYRVLHDAYLQGLPNRQIARSLYISARTFDRDRRQALGRVCQIVWEMETACRLSRPSGSGAPSCVRTQ